MNGYGQVKQKLLEVANDQADVLAAAKRVTAGFKRVRMNGHAILDLVIGKPDEPKR